tara:strand:- start:152 stop:715 length:564 start_codon:yes stop_codon:yes gene_type:complete
MAYKYTTGSVNRGDLYAESSVDSDGNTYIDFSEDAIGLVAGGTTNFVVSSSTVGIGTVSPSSTFEVSGSQAGNYTAVTGNATLDKTHYIVDYTGDGSAVITLPAVSGLAGRIYHIMCNAQNSGGEDVLHINANGSETIVGANVEGTPINVGITGSNTPQSVTVVCTGARWQILSDARSQQEGNGNGE